VGAVGRDRLTGPTARPVLFHQLLPWTNVPFRFSAFYFVSLCSVRRLHLGQNFFSVSLSCGPAFLNFVVW
jgi:hypothetical protein